MFFSLTSQWEISFQYLARVKPICDRNKTLRTQHQTNYRAKHSAGRMRDAAVLVFPRDLEREPRADCVQRVRQSDSCHSSPCACDELVAVLYYG